MYFVFTLHITKMLYKHQFENYNKHTFTVTNNFEDENIKSVQILVGYILYLISVNIWKKYSFQKI